MNQYEFIRERKVFGFPYGMYAALLTERIEAENVHEVQAHSYAFYRRLTLTSQPNPILFSFRIREDYYYHLDALRVAWPPKSTEPWDESPPLNVELSKGGSSRSYQDEPVPLPLVTSPTVGRALRYMVRGNVTFLPAELIMIRISGQNGTDPAFVDIMTEGFRIPREYRTLV